MPKPKKTSSAEITPNEEAELAKLEQEANKAAEKGREGEEITPAPESAPEETKTPSKEKEPEPKVPEAGEEEFSEEELAHFKEKAQKRIRKLSQEAARAKKLEGEVRYLKERSTTLPAGQPPVSERPVSEGLPWETPTGEPREISIEEYEKEVSKKAQRIVQRELANERRFMQLREDVKSIETKYPLLNIDGENFDQDLAYSIADWYKGLSQTSPNLRLSTFVDKIMGLRKKGAEQEKSKVTAKVAKQAARQAVTPTGAPVKGEEGLEQIIGSARTMEELEEAEKLLPHS